MIVFKINGKIVTKKQWDRNQGVGLTPGQAPMGTVAYSESKPWFSESAGFLPHQVPEARKIIKERGLVGVDVLDDGRVRCTSRGKAGVGGRNGLIDLRGMTDYDGGYSDK